MQTSFNKLKIINIFIRFFILGAVFLIPLVFDAFSFLDSVFTYPKTFILYIFVGGLFVSTLIKVLYLKRIEVNKKVFRHILWPSIYILVLIFSTFFAYDLNQALIGSYSRQFGLLTHFFLYLWFVLLLFNLSLKPRLVKINTIYKTIALSAFLVSIYGALQYFGIDFVQWSEAAINTKRAFSTLGQPNYLGLYIVMVIPIFFYLFKIEKNKYLKYFWLISALFSISAWFFTGSRSAWLGLFLTGFIFIVYLLIKKKNIIKSKSFIIIILALILVFTALFSNTAFNKRLSSSLDFNIGSVATRFLYWEASYDKIIKSPIIGYGLEQQKHVLRDAYTKEWAVHEKLNTYSDRAHNIVLDYLLIGGVLLLFVYFMILRSWFIQAFKALKANNYQIAILILALSSYLITLFFSFEIIVSSLYFWLFGALIIVGVNKNNQDDNNFKVFHLRFSELTKKVLVFALLLILLLFLYMQLQKIIANHYFLASKAAISRASYNESLLLYNYSKATSYSHDHYSIYFADAITFLFVDENRQAYRELALELDRIAKSLKSSDYDQVLAKARVASVLGDYKEAEDYYFKAISIVPELSKTYLDLANNYVLKEDFEKALKYYDVAINKTPSIDNEKLNNEHKTQLKTYRSLVWEKKGDVYYKQSEYDKAVMAYNKAYDYNLYQVQLLKKIADSYYFKDDIGTAILYNKKGKQRRPDDPMWSTALAWLYFQIGNTEEAKLQLQEALFINPDYGEALDLKKEFNFNF